MGGSSVGKLPEFRIPVVGEQATVHQVMVSVVATCPCGSKVPIVIGSLASVVACEGCGDEYFIRHLQADTVSAGEGSLNIGLQRLTKAAPTTD